MSGIEIEFFGNFLCSCRKQIDHCHFFLGVDLTEQIGKHVYIGTLLRIHFYAVPVYGIQFRQRAAENFFYLCELLFFCIHLRLLL